MKLLVTGANGFVGHAVVSACLCAGHDVVALVRSPAAQCSLVEELAAYPEALRVLVVPDLANLTTLADQSLLSDVTVVIHCAGAAHASKTDASFYRVNAEGVDSFAGWCAAHAVQRFILLSSIKVFPSDCVAINRHTPTGPDTEYGRSKQAGEIALLRHCRESAMACTLLRFPLVYGTDFKGNLALLKHAARLRLPLPLSDVHNRKSLLHLDTLVSLILVCLHSRARAEILLIADPEPYSTEALYRYICSQLDIKCRTFSQASLLGRLARQLADRIGFGDKLFGNLEVDVSDEVYPANWQPGPGILEGLNNAD